MVLTVLDAHVDPDRAEELVRAYRALAAAERPAGLVRSHLLQNVQDRTAWRVETLWRSRQDLEAMRGQGTPAGVLLFRSVGAEPTVSIHEVEATIE